MNLPAVRRREMWDPFKDLWNLRDEMERLFVPSNRGRLSHLSDDSGVWMMPVEIRETDDHIVVRTDLPGLEAKDIDVSILGTALTIKAERKQEREMKEEDLRFRELAYGAFQRQIELPQEVKADAVSATYKNGVLELRLPKQEAGKRKLIKVDVK